MNFSEHNLSEAIGATTQERPQQQTHPAPQMFDAFHQSPHGEFKPTFYNPFEVKHRRRTSRQQLKVLEKAFNENPKPHAAVRQALAQKLNMTSRGVQVWFQNRRAKAKKQKSVDDNPSPESNPEGLTVSSPSDSLETLYAADSTVAENVGQESIESDSSTDDNSDQALADSNVNSPNAVYCETFFVDQAKPVDEILDQETENDQLPKRSRQKPNINPLKTSWDTPEEYEHMVQRRQIHDGEWNISSASTVTSSDYVYDHMDNIIPLSTPQSAVTISDYFPEYNTYSPTVSSVISDKDAIDCNEPMHPAYANTRRNSCPELMASILNMKLGTPEEKRSLSTIIEDETLYNDSNMSQFLAVPAQVKRRFSEPINKYNMPNVSGFPSEHGQELGTTMPSMTSNQASFAFNLSPMLNANHSHDANPHTAPELLRGHSFDSTVWSALKGRPMWNFGLDFKPTKLPIVDTTELKVTGSGTLDVTHWTHNADANSVNSSMNVAMADDIRFMHHLYDNSNNQVV
ncbi:6833_t:CDS:2 [Acaulospora colombiana]|uniref:6833_t:CDS:1 n=1 Tax=Acaulospora colombiana TaxID=27376 RepID=A0ACA9LMW4_9GLOM|nr:6833_t:CDS:2 [Acaulospora colombiana]